MIQTLLHRLRPERTPTPAVDPIRRFVETLARLEERRPPPPRGGGGRISALDLVAAPFARSPRSPS
ncbi:hypothetical protein [Phreatobacter cathodiphilus]|uniref:Uncharacterized protein n=1 Tax=Phreatobacter cathodiphilus TaxID=1868589 RepID=A0A2S0N7D6_9HYPH|nr:hypothetical protein [Phreatobacter cathodiphilus]AVO44058.1 hypothetical protein C6569_02690 [Phreatobacter cathodiphilus]